MKLRCSAKATKASSQSERRVSRGIESYSVKLSYLQIHQFRENAAPLMLRGMNTSLLEQERALRLAEVNALPLPWHQLWAKHEAPGDKAWRKMTARVDMHLLCLFMVADRVDCPGAWRANAALTWFLDESTRRGLLTRELVLDA